VIVKEAESSRAPSQDFAFRFELGNYPTSGLMALITAIIGAAVVSNLSLLVLDIGTERAASRGPAAAVVDLSETEHLETEHLETEHLEPEHLEPEHGAGAPGAGAALIARTMSWH
jgi:hypothetical protein